jgi:outer membrane protein assembly factor BamE (lipoprotein component of BamABCDE complex)
MLIRTLSLFLLAAALTAAATPAVPCLASPFVPQIVAAMGRQLDRQVVARLHQKESPAQGVSLFMTTPVDVNDLESSNPLARQIQEELASWFAQAG